MKERPILFFNPMVRALLDGTKTQTRRIFKAKNGGVWPSKNDIPGMRQILRNCPYGQPGDRLWVRETWCGEVDGHTSTLIYNEDGNTYKCLYRADGQHVVFSDGDGFTKTNKDGSEASPWKPSIHMPRWASRITLEITRVRIERLQAINEVDAIAEGAPWAACGSPQDGSHKAGYAQLWESVNGPDSWGLNPWVWVIEFKRVQP